MDKLELAILSAILVLSFVGVVVTGSRGFYSFDQSIVINGANNIIHGQVPFRDFDVAYGAVVFYIQAFSFKLGGVNYFATIWPAAIESVLFTLLSYLLLSELIKDKKIVLKEALPTPA